jgi:hypothetical protein
MAVAPRLLISFYEKYIRRFFTDILVAAYALRSGVKLVRSILHYLLPTDAIVLAAREFDAKGNRETARKIIDTVYRRSWSWHRALLPLIRLLARQGDQEALKQVILDFSGKSLKDKLISLRDIRRAHELIGTRAAAWEADILEPLMRCQDENIRAQNRLLTDHRHPLYSIARGRMGQWFFLVELANKNLATGAPAADYQAFHHGHIGPVGEIQGPIIEFLLPPHFFSVTVTEAAVHERVCVMLCDILDELVTLGGAIVPRHQMHLNAALPTGYWPAFSYHTCGDREGWWHIKETALPGYFRFDRQGYSGWSELAGLDRLPDVARLLPPSTLEEFWEGVRHSVVIGRASKYSQKVGGPALPSKAFVFFAMQLLDDSVSVLADIPMLKAIEKARETLAICDIKLVVKRHPKCDRQDVTRFLRRLSTDPNVVVYEGPIHEAIDRSSAVVTVNSGVGFEALFHEKRVITLGSSEYAFATERVRTLDELSAALSDTKRSPDIDRIKRFVWFYAQGCVASDDKNALSATLKQILSSSPAPL